MTIWVDADACPNAIKEILFKASMRVEISLKTYCEGDEFEQAEKDVELQAELETLLNDPRNPQ